MSIRSGLVVEMQPADQRPGRCWQRISASRFSTFCCQRCPVPLEVAEHGEDSVAPADFGYTVRAAGGVDLLAGGIVHRLSFQ